MTPHDELKNGISILDPIMTKYGFKFVVGSIGSGSGGEFASGYYEKGSRRLNLSVRYSLGCVTYQVGETEISHSEYMRVIDKKGKYPGFSNQIKKAFEHLANDVKLHGSTFLSSSDCELRHLIESAESNPKKKGFGALAWVKT